MEAIGEGGRERSEGKRAFTCNIDDTAQADADPDAVDHHEGGVVGQVVRCRDVQIRYGYAKPLHKSVRMTVCIACLYREDEGDGAEVFGGDGLLCGKRMVTAKEYAPFIFFRTGKSFILRAVDRTINGCKVDEPLIEEFQDRTCIAAADV